jgi:uncharacterized membrane protein
MTQGTYQTLEIDAPAADLYDVAADVAAYPQWATGVKSVDVLESDAAGRVLRAEFVVEVFVKEIDYVLRYNHDYPHKLSWTAEPGEDLKMMEGSYTFNDIEGGVTEVIYALNVEPTFTIPGFILRQGEKQLVTTALRGLRKRATGA